MGYGRSCRHAIPFMWCCYLLMWLCIYVGIMKLLCMAQASRKATPCHYWTPSVASRSCPRLALPTAAPQKLALTLIPTWMPTPALLQLGLSLLSNLRGHNLSTGVDRAAETPAPSTAHHDDAQAPAPAPHHALKLVTMKTPYGRSCYNSPRWVDTLHRPPHALDAQGVEPADKEVEG